MSYPDVIIVHKVLQTGDNPILCTTNDFHNYILKHNIRGSGRRKLINEWIAFKLFSHLDVRCPEASLVWFDPVSFSEELRPLTGRFQRHLCFASKKLSHHKDLKDDLYVKKSNKIPLLNNPEELGKILVMDLWLKNNDRTWNNLNLILSDREVFAIDHSSIFDEQSFDRLTNQTILDFFIEPKERGDLLVNSEFFRYQLSKFDSEIRAAGIDLCNRIAVLQENQLEYLLATVPAEWRFSTEEKEAVKNYLQYRQNLLLDRFEGHLNFG